MKNIYTVPFARWPKYSDTTKWDKRTLQIEIAEGFSKCCTKPLLLMLHQMNKTVASFE